MSEELSILKLVKEERLALYVDESQAISGLEKVKQGNMWLFNATP